MDSVGICIAVRHGEHDKILVPGARTRFSLQICKNFVSLVLQDVLNFKVTQHLIDLFKWFSQSEGVLFSNSWQWAQALAKELSVEKDQE